MNISHKKTVSKHAASKIQMNSIMYLFHLTRSSEEKGYKQILLTGSVKFIKFLFTKTKKFIRQKKL